MRLKPAAKRTPGETGVKSAEIWVSRAVIVRRASAPGVTLESSVGLTASAGTSVSVGVELIVGDCVGMGGGVAVTTRSVEVSVGAGVGVTSGAAVAALAVARPVTWVPATSFVVAGESEASKDAVGDVEVSSDEGRVFCMEACVTDWLRAACALISAATPVTPQMTPDSTIKPTAHKNNCQPR